MVSQISPGFIVLLTDKECFQSSHLTFRRKLSAKSISQIVKLLERCLEYHYNEISHLVYFQL